MIEQRNFAGTRDNRHFHHLKGTLRCGECGNLLSFSRSKGRHAHYDYFYCLSKSRCSQPFIATDEAEEAVEDLFEVTAMPKETADALLEGLKETVAELRGDQDRERARLERKADHFERERYKLMQAFYAEAISLDVLKQEQQRISTQAAKVTRRLDTLSTRLDDAQAEIETALRLASTVRAPLPPLRAGDPPQVQQVDLQRDLHRRQENPALRVLRGTGSPHPNRRHHHGRRFE